MCILQCSCFPAILLITQYCIAGSRMTLWMMLMIIIINDADDDDDHHYDADDDASCCSILHWSALQGPGATGRRGRCCMLPLRNKPPRCNTSSSPSSDHCQRLTVINGGRGGQEESRQEERLLSHFKSITHDNSDLLFMVWKQ